MKKTIAVLVLLLAAGVVVLLLKRQAVSRKAAEAPGAPARGSLSLSGAWALYPLAVRWQEEFQKSHPGTVVDVQAGGAGKGIADALAGVVDIGMVSREINPAEVEKGAVALAVAKDAVVATVSAKNPLLADILRHGLKKEDLAALWMRGLTKSWEALLDPVVADSGAAGPRSTSSPAPTPAAPRRPGPPTSADTRRTWPASASTATRAWPRPSAATRWPSASTTSISPTMPRP